jgi:8-oxo-dGTP pyrophosphatase MutT (NUDIX family)
MATAAGTVIIDNGMVLLRYPAGGFGGYAWTFSKGRPDKGETLEQAAERETFEETGYEVVIGRKIGDFPGTTTTTTFFLASNAKKTGEPHWETEKLQWFSPEEARKAIMETPNDTGRERDLAVLAAALEAAGIKEETPEDIDAGWG